jgi:hypothetical protein
MGDKCDCNEYKLYHRASVICLVALLLLLAGLGIFAHHEFSQKKADESYDICNATMTERPEINGLWFIEGYYCVWAAGRNLKEINTTDVHEKCHALINDDPKHFCKSSCEK